ncbi:hypothetical protein P3L10_018039 [Capsicum annuum]
MKGTRIMFLQMQHQFLIISRQSVDFSRSKTLVFPHEDKEKKCEKEFSIVISKRKKPSNQLVVEEVINDDNFVVALHPTTVEKL